MKFHSTWLVKEKASSSKALSFNGDMIVSEKLRLDEMTCRRPKFCDKD